jgi:hypothetical protein
MFGRKKPAEESATDAAPPAAHVDSESSGGLPPIDSKPFSEAIWPVLACGAGLFSDGYVNNVRYSCPVHGRRKMLVHVLQGYVQVQIS